MLLNVHQISLMPSVDGQKVGLVMLMGVGNSLRSKQNGWLNYCQTSGYIASLRRKKGTVKGEL